MKIFLANPRGFCAGVHRAISIVHQAIKLYGIPIYVLHELIHNRYVIQNLNKRGVVFIKKISEVPDNSILIFSAHGVSKKIYKEAQLRNLYMLFDATCPLVTKVHMEVQRASFRGNEVILIGHSDHPEVKGTIGQYHNLKAGIYLVESIIDVYKIKVKNTDNLYYVTQTTLSIDDTKEIIHALYKRFPKIIGPRKNDICYATTNRQEAVRNLANHVDIILILGSKNSSNANRLVELAKRIRKFTYFIDSVLDVKKYWFKNVRNVGISAGASVPEILVQKVIYYLINLESSNVYEINGHEENMIFQIPKKLHIDVKLLN
ncbi:4-hydroxy-3-methylbut-2-enyl diphosphate reductase [Candidatus Ecksteinia adelgidicola]|nr:4-hydroxy-3-methylbut-2-enyl diphosphate reductase [Candidatus Ecksteinia adelgidicola]